MELDSRWRLVVDRLQDDPRLSFEAVRPPANYQPKQITDIKKFLEIARRKDATRAYL